MKGSKNYSNQNRNLIPDSQIAGDNSIDEKIRQSVDYAARVRNGLSKIDKQTGNVARGADLPLPRHFKTKHENNAKHGEVK
jgi:hypothetical protein